MMPLKVASNPLRGREFFEANDSMCRRGCPRVLIRSLGTSNSLLMGGPPARCWAGLFVRVRRGPVLRFTAKSARDVLPKDVESWTLPPSSRRIYSCAAEYRVSPADCDATAAHTPALLAVERRERVGGQYPLCRKSEY